MSSRKLHDGFRAVGFVSGLSNGPMPANFEIHDGKPELTVMLIGDDPLELLNAEQDDIPHLVLFSSTEIKLNISQIRLAREKSELFSGVGTKTFEVGRVVRTSESIDHDQVHGMVSELEGFDRWAEQQSISQELIFKEQLGEPPVAVLKAEVRQPTLLGSSFKVQANAGYLLPSHDPDSTSYTIHNVATLRSETEDLRLWSEHQQIHRMVQDLMCLVYSYPCELTIKEILRTDNQPYFQDNHGSEGKYYWHEAYASNFGRTRHLEPRKQIEDFEPLFKLSDTNPADVESWIENFDKWSRPTWIAVESIFQPHLAAESKMLLMGSALEALGYAIWLYEEHDGEMPSGRKPSAARYFERVAETLPWSELNISEEETAKEWSEKFNAVYKGCKHADNDIPGGLEAHYRAKQGLLVIRCWLAKKLGIKDETLIKNIKYLQDAGSL